MQRVISGTVMRRRMAQKLGHFLLNRAFGRKK
jgi:hypothetical protein